MNKFSKIWMINLALAAAVLFVYGGLNMFNNKDPEAANLATNGQSFISKVKSWFEGKPNDKEVEYVRMEDGTMLPLKDSEESNEVALSEVSKHVKPRLNELSYEISVAEKRLKLAAEMLSSDSKNELLIEEFQQAQDDLELLRDEQAELTEQLNGRSNSGL